MTMSGQDIVELPPNLYFIGTVNVDETTQGFADKIYDRAQVIEVTHDRNEIASRIQILEIRDVLMAIWDALAEVMPFSIRVVDEINKYVAEAAQIGIPWEESFDDQIIQKILPRVRGTDIRFGVMLQKLNQITANRFPRSNYKIQQLSYSFHTNGIVSFF